MDARSGARACRADAPRFAAARADKWTLEPGFRITPTISSNLNLAPPGQEESGAYLQLAPRIRFTGAGARYNVSGYYELGAYLYTTDQESSNFYSNALLNGNVELAENLFYLDANASISQNFLLGVQSDLDHPGTCRGQRLHDVQLWPESVPAARDRRIRVSAAVGQPVDHVLGRRGQLRCSTRTTRPDRARVEPNPALRLDGGVHRQRNRFDEQQPFSTEVATRAFSTTRRIPDLRLSARGGYEWNNYYLKSTSPARSTALAWIGRRRRARPSTHSGKSGSLAPRTA